MCRLTRARIVGRSIIRRRDASPMELRSDPWIINYTHIERAYIYTSPFVERHPYIEYVYFSIQSHTYHIYKLNEYPHLYIYDFC